MLVYGIILSLPGTVLGLPETAAELGLTLTSRGSLISALFVGLLLGSLLSGSLVDTLGYRTSLAVSSGLVAFALPLLAVTRTPLLAGVVILALGVASAGMNTASNALSSDLFPGERARRMNRLAILVGIGGVMMPVTTVVSSVVVSWRTVASAGGVLAALVALACAWVPPASASVSSHSLGLAIRRFARLPGFVWLAAELCVSVVKKGSENSPLRRAEDAESVVVNGFTEKIIGAAIEVHKVLGPGLVESAYEECLGHELHLATFPLNARCHSRYLTSHLARLRVSARFLS